MKTFKYLVFLLVPGLFFLAGCKKTVENEDTVFEATINGLYWKATTATAEPVANLPAFGFYITAYGDDNKVIYLTTKEGASLISASDRSKPFLSLLPQAEIQKP